jgi:hypothetical protein
VKEGVFEIERIGETMRGIDAYHERLFAVLGQMDTGGGGYAGFADAAFAAVEKN